MLSWLNVTIDTTLFENKQLAQLHENLCENTDYWNEYELEFFFISLLIQFFANYKSRHFVMYAERQIEADVKAANNDIIHLITKTDLMLAKGVGEILKIPYLCFHEYKRTKKNPSDPIAQVLKAMLIAQEMNKNGKPVYGAYVIGKDWYFMIMEGREYCISKAYQATEKDELIQIIAILRAFRVILETTLRLKHFFICYIWGYSKQKSHVFRVGFLFYWLFLAILLLFTLVIYANYANSLLDIFKKTPSCIAIIARSRYWLGNKIDTLFLLPP